jgi:hypothetical protein
MSYRLLCRVNLFVLGDRYGKTEYKQIDPTKQSVTHGFFGVTAKTAPVKAQTVKNLKKPVVTVPKKPGRTKTVTEMLFFNR